MKYFALFFSLLSLWGCTGTPSPERILGEWHQDSDYLQSKGLVNQLAEITSFEDYEMFFTKDWFAATRIVGNERNDEGERVYWSGGYNLRELPDKTYQLEFTSREGSPLKATVSFEGKRLLLQIENRKLAFLPGKAINLHIKKYISRESARDNP